MPERERQASSGKRQASGTALGHPYPKMAFFQKAELDRSASSRGYLEFSGLAMTRCRARQAFRNMREAVEAAWDLAGR